MTTKKIALGDLQTGQKGTVSGLQGGRVFAARMAALGFTPGAEIAMIQNFKRGPVIVLVRGTRIALGRGEASRVLVHSTNGGSHG